MSRLTQRAARTCVVVACLLATIACGAQPPGASDSARTSTPSQAAVAASPKATERANPQAITFKAARSVSMTQAADGGVYLVLGAERELLVARAQEDGQTFSEPVRASGAVAVYVNPIERPALATAAAGQIAVAWLEQQAPETTIWYSQSSDGGRSFEPPREVSRTDAPETTMVRIAFDRQNNPLLAWLQGGALVLARSNDRGASFTATQTVDAQVCECCQPDPLVHGEQVVLGFRNLVRDGAHDLRDIHVVTSSDGGATFGEPVRVSDSSWQINACPISGPALALDGERLYVAWMDGRNDHEHTGARGDLWLASSTDGGRTFTPNVRVNPQAEDMHTLPALTIGPDGRLHLSWELTDDQRTAIVYTTSDDHGATFAEPQILVSSDDGLSRGHPTAPSLVVTPAGQVYLAWVDRLGAHVLAWNDKDGPPARH